MRLSLQNVGAIEKADIELSDITIVTGKNNTGKSAIFWME